MSNLGGKNVSEDTDKDVNVDSLVAGANIDSIDSSDPRNPIINASDGSGGQVDSVVGGTNCSVDATDPVNPIVNADTQNNAKVTTKGDLEGFSTEAARIPVGTNGQHLEADSTQALGLKWATPAGGGGGSLAGAAVTVTADLTSLNNVETPIPWETEDYDDNNFVDLGTDDDRFTVPTGVTRVNIYAFFRYTLVTAGQLVGLTILRRDSSDSFVEYVSHETQTSPNGAAGSVSATALGVECVAGDYFTINRTAGDAAWSIIQARAAIQVVS